MKRLLRQVAILSWIIVTVTVFMYYPGRISFIFGSSLAEVGALGAKLARIDLFAYLRDLALGLAGMLVYAVSTTAAGSALFLIERQPPRNTDRPAAAVPAVCTASLAGQAAFAAVFIVLAINRALEPRSVLVVLAAGLIGGALPLTRLARQLMNHQNVQYGEAADDTTPRTLKYLVLGIILLSLGQTTARLSYDSVALYFSDAKITALSHQIQFFQDDSFIVSSLQTSIHQAALMQVFGDQAARMYTWANGLVIIVMVVALANEMGVSVRARWLLAALIVSSTAFLDLMGDGKVDLASTAPAIAASYWLLRAVRAPEASSYARMGLLAGLAIAARPFNAFVLPVCILAYLILEHRSQREDGPRPTGIQRIAFLLTAGAWMLAIIAYHLALNWAVLGHPLAPFINYARVDPSRWQWAFDPRQLNIIRLLYPLAVTYINSPQSLGNISPLFLAALPLIALREVRLRLLPTLALRNLIVAAAISLFVWILAFFTVIEIRYVLFLWMLLFIPAALVLERGLRAEEPGLRGTLSVAITVLLVFTAIRVLYLSLDTYSPIDRQGNAHCYDHGMCTFITPVNTLAPAGARVLTLNAYRYYLRTDLFTCSTSHSEYAALKDAAAEGMPAFWDEVYRQGYDYLLYEWNYTERHLYITTAPDPSNAPAWIHLVPISGKPGDEQVAYKIELDKPPSIPRVGCRIDDGGFWRVSAAPVQ